jgi:hypothetical protein
MNGINEEIFHPEQGLYRGLTGSSSYFPDADGRPTQAVLPTTGSIPIAKAWTGTFTTSNTAPNDPKVVRGNASQFITDGICPGDYLYNGGLVRKIVDVISQDMLVLEREFPASLTAQPVAICKPQTFKKITAEATAAATLQGTAISDGEKFISGGSPIGYSGDGIVFTVSK